MEHYAALRSALAGMFEPSAEETPEGNPEKEEPVDGRFAALAGVPGMDVPAGIENSGDADSYFEKLRSFYNLIDENTVLLNSLCETGNLTNYAIGIQALKNSAQLIGAVQLGEKADTLETAAEAGDDSFIRSNHALFMEQYMALKSVLAGMFPAK